MKTNALALYAGPVRRNSRFSRTIPGPEKEPFRYYEALGVDRNASQDEIRKAFKRLALELHPDRGGSTEAFQQLSEVAKTLMDTQLRTDYDCVSGMSYYFSHYLETGNEKTRTMAELEAEWLERKRNSGETAETKDNRVVMDRDQLKKRLDEDESVFEKILDVAIFYPGEPKIQKAPKKEKAPFEQIYDLYSRVMDDATETTAEKKTPESDLDKRLKDILKGIKLDDYISEKSADVNTKIAAAKPKRPERTYAQRPKIVISPDIGSVPFIERAIETDNIVMIDILARKHSYEYLPAFSRMHLKANECDLRISDPTLKEGVFDVDKGSITVDLTTMPNYAIVAKADDVYVEGFIERDGKLVPEGIKDEKIPDLPVLWLSVRTGHIDLIHKQLPPPPKFVMIPREDYLFENRHMTPYYYRDVLPLQPSKLFRSDQTHTETIPEPPKVDRGWIGNGSGSNVAGHLGTKKKD